MRILHKSAALIVLLLMSCSSVPTETVELPESPSPTTTALPATATPTQQLPTSTWTPLPTLPPEEAIERVLSLLENNGGCELPCWWGITPGETTLTDAFHMLTNANVGRVSLFPYDSEPTQVIAKPLIPDEYNPFFFYPPHTYFVSENKIELIEIDLGLLPHYALSFLLQEFGLPTEVRINTLVEPFRGAFNFVLYVYYDGVGILAQYDVQGQLIDEKVYGCPQTDARTILILWQPEQSTTFEQIADRTILWNWYSDGSGIYPAQDIESISDLTTLDFYNKFDGSDPSACIESPVSFWPWLVQQ